MTRGLDISIFLKMAGDLTKPMRDAENKVKASTERMKKNMTLSLKLAGAGAAATGIKMVTNGIVSNFTESYREVQRASGDLRSLGMKDIQAVIAQGQKLQNTYVGLSTEAFVRAAYDIKSGVSSLTDEGVAAMTASALTVAKATKGMPEAMTSLFATSYGIFKKQFSEMSDADWGDMFGAALSASVQKFKTDGAKMQQAIESAGAGATNLGLKMTEQMTLLGMMQQQMQAGEAGTALRAFATNAAKAHEKFSEMKVTSERPVRVRILDENGQLRAMPDILTDLKNRYGETLDAFEAAEIKDAFGTDEAMKMINALYGQEEAVRANAAALEDAAKQGAVFTKGMADKVDDYEGSGWDLFNQQMKSMKEQIGAGLLPALDKLAPVFGSMAQSLGGFISRNPELVAGFGAIVVGLGGIAAVAAPVLFAFSSLTVMFGAARHGSLLMGLAMRGTGQKTGLLARGVKVLSGSFGILKTALVGIGRVLLANPIGLAIAVIAGGAYLIYKYWEPIKAFFSGLWESVKSVTSTAWEGIKSGFLNYTPYGLIIKHWDSISGWFGNLWEGVKSATATAWEGIKSGFLNYTPHGLIITHWDQISTYFGTLWEGVKTTFATKWADIKASTITWATDFTALGGNIISGLTSGITAGVQSAIDTIANVGNSIVSKFKSILGIASPSKVFASFGGHLMDGLISGLKAKLAAVKAAITGIGSSVVGWFKDKLGIKSPSRVFMGLGGHLSEGLAIGIDQDKGHVFASMERIRKGLAQPIMATASIGMGAMASAAAACVPGIGLAEVGQVSAPRADIANTNQVSAPGTDIANIDQISAYISNAGKSVSISFAPIYHLAISGEFTQDQEERLRLILQEHDRDQRFELERLLND